MRTCSRSGASRPKGPHASPLTSARTLSAYLTMKVAWRSTSSSAHAPAAMAIEPGWEDKSDDGLTDQERKLEAYLENLEALENPTIDELTMLGEMAFEAQENQAAYDHYLEVIDNHADDPKSAFALYKLAWTEYNLGDVDAAIEDMELMLEWMDEGDGPLEELLRTAGPNDLALFKKKAMQ